MLLPRFLPLLLLLPLSYGSFDVLQASKKAIEKLQSLVKGEKKATEVAAVKKEKREMPYHFYHHSFGEVLDWVFSFSMTIFS